MRKDHVGSGLGIVSIIPDQRAIVVGRRFCVDITYKAGSKGVDVGGVIRFKLPGLILGAGKQGPVSCSNPRVKWTSSNHVPAIDGKNGDEFGTNTYLFVVVREARLNEGDSITVHYGSQILLTGTAAPAMAQPWPVEVAVDVEGLRSAPGSGFYLVENPPVLNFVNGSAARLEVFVPSYTRVGEDFRTTIRVLDRYCNLVEDYLGTVFLEQQTDSGVISLGGYTFTAQHKGVFAVEHTQMPTPGIHRIRAHDEALGISARSNPTKTTTEEPSVKLHWGDTHCHSSISADTAAINAMIRRPAGDYDYARNRAALDFCMVTDHIEDQSEQDWTETRAAARAACEPGRFVTFSGFEATYQPLRQEGDKNVCFLNDDEAWVKEGTTEELYENLKQRKTHALVIPHLHCPTNWDRHDPELERVVEVYAHWGCGLSEHTDLPIVPGTPRPASSYVHHALEQGCKLGFVASADHSYGHPGDDFWWELSNYSGGVAAVFSSELSRLGIWKGLWSRHCYGTTRARILLEFEINGHMMGEEFAVAESTRDMKINVYGTSAIAVIEIVKNSRVLQSFPGDRRIDLELTHCDNEAERETDYYYIHVRQEDGEQAWSSPVWVRGQQTDAGDGK